jgi:hypothetical protein
VLLPGATDPEEGLSVNCTVGTKIALMKPGALTVAVVDGSVGFAITISLGKILVQVPNL